VLWEIPDDPRGSLRWSLSKLRRLVDDDARPRILADRVTVGFDAADVVIDVAALKALTDGQLDHCPLEQLEDAAARLCGNPLEGLELPDFHAFDAWCLAERSCATRAQTRLLAALIRRLSDDPERALPHASALVRIAPYDEKARATLIRLLVALGRNEQAEQQYQVGARMLKEAGAEPAGELHRAWRGAPTATATRVEREPRPARRVHEPPSAQTASTVPTAPTAQTVSTDRLVGRDAEVEHLATALSHAIEHRRGAFVLVSGEPGIGKTSLLAAAGARARDAGALVLEACAYESEAIRPFALWIDALRKLGPDAALAIFGQGDHANRDRLFSGLGNLIAERARTQPVVLMFDDLQWGDESSAAALHYVARTNTHQPLLGILAARGDELRDNTPVLRALRELRQAGLLEELRLGPLAEDALRKLINTRSPQANSQRLSKECGGNPLLAIELARAEAAGDSGQSLADLVQERLARLDIDGGEVLSWAAVLAPRIDAATLARVTGLDWNRIGEALEMAARQSMLLPTERGFRFSHDLIARSIYAALSPARRRTMHRRVAELLEQDTALDPCLTLELREIMLTAAPVEHWEAAAREYAALPSRRSITARVQGRPHIGEIIRGPAQRVSGERIPRDDRHRARPPGVGPGTLCRAHRARREAARG